MSTQEQVFAGIPTARFDGHASDRWHAKGDTMMRTGLVGRCLLLLSVAWLLAGVANAADTRPARSGSVPAGAGVLETRSRDNAAGIPSGQLPQNVTQTQEEPLGVQSHVAYAVGDVFAGVGAGKVNHYGGCGTLLEVLNTGSGSLEETGMCFDAAGNLYATNWTA